MLTCMVMKSLLSQITQLIQMPNLSGKHAHWWLKVFGHGVKRIDVIYRPGRALQDLMLSMVAGDDVS